MLLFDPVRVEPACDLSVIHLSWRGLHGGGHPFIVACFLYGLDSISLIAVYLLSREGLVSTDTRSLAEALFSFRTLFLLVRWVWWQFRHHFVAAISCFFMWTSRVC